MLDKIKLTQYSHGAGCGCKIAPSVLSTILHSSLEMPEDKRLLVGNISRDDAAVYDLGDGTAIISTTDFFMPIVDDPITFGRIAATNAISDIYAMGGTPLLAIAILGWPIQKLAPEIAQAVTEGGRLACRDAGIMLAGGHSIDSPEPIFGLAVTGRVNISHLKQNNAATAGCKLYLTKPLGVGILSTAQKKMLLAPEDGSLASLYMTQLNSIGIQLGQIESVMAMTDVTGFGLLGHLWEVCQGSGLAATIYLNRIPVIPQAIKYIDLGAIPGGTFRNWDSYGQHIRLTDPNTRNILCDPQTSGGLLIAVDPKGCDEVEQLLRSHQLPYTSIGDLHHASAPMITVS